MNLEEVKQQIKEKMREDELQYINTVTDGIMELQPKPVTITEDVFKEFFLPYISGEIPVSKESIQAFTHNMLQLTNSYYLPINVVDNDGNLLFTLPPYMYELKDNDLLKYLNYNMLVKEYTELKDVMKDVADAKLEARLRELEKLLHPDDEKEKEYLINILKIYKRYGLLKDEIDNNADNNNEDDELEIEY